MLSKLPEDAHIRNIADNIKASRGNHLLGTCAFSSAVDGLTTSQSAKAEKDKKKGGGGRWTYQMTSDDDEWLKVPEIERASRMDCME